MFGGVAAAVLAKHATKAKVKPIEASSPMVGVTLGSGFIRHQQCVVAIRASEPIQIGEPVSVWAPNGSGHAFVRRSKEGELVYGICVQAPDVTGRTEILCS